MTERIFISHSSDERADAAAICDALEAAGHACWMAPRDITPGVDWAEAIMAAIAGAKLMVLVHSVAAASSPMVLRELDAAVGRKCPVLTILADGVEPAEAVRFYVGTSHWLSVGAGGVGAHLPGIVAAATARMRGETAPRVAGVPFIDRPAIAILPFRARGAVAAHMAEDFTEELIAAISSWRVYPVISRNSVYALGEGENDPRQVGRILGARYIVTGTLRRDAAMRVSLEFIDSGTGNLLLAESFTGSGDDPEQAQAAILMAIAGAISPELHRMEQARARDRPSANPTAHELMQQGFYHRRGTTREDLVRAEALFRQALTVDPQYARALVALSICRNYAAQRRWTDDTQAAFRESLELARAATAADPRYPRAHFAAGLAMMNLGRRGEAEAAYREAIALDPSAVAARANLGQLFNYLDRSAEAVVQLEIALRLSRRDPFRYQWLPYMAASHYLAGRYRECLDVTREALEEHPEFPLAIRYLVAALGMLDRPQDAAAGLTLMRRIDGDFARLEAMTRRLFVPSAAERLLGGFRRAGIG